MRKLSVLILLVVGLCMVPALVQADSITVGDPLWYEFHFGLAGTFATTGVDECVPSSSGNSQFAPDPAWTFATASGTRVTIVDAFQAGDQFQLYDFGSPIGATTFVANTGTFITDDPAVAVGNAALSRGFFSLAPGAHSLDIQVVQNALDTTAGCAYFRVDVCPPVPLPPSVLLFGTSLLGLAGLRLRRRNLA